jgi:hypothetical protein
MMQVNEVMVSSSGSSLVITLESLDEKHWKLSVILVPPSGDPIRDTGIFHSLPEIADALSQILSMLKSMEETSPTQKSPFNSKELDPFNKELKKIIKKKLDN